MKRAIKFQAKHKRTGAWEFFTLKQAWEFHDLIDWDTVGEYIGRTDKNGTEIYEGDIVGWGISPVAGQSRRKHPGIVVWGEDGAYFRIKDPRHETGVAWNAYGKDLWCEVIGNRDDNPELVQRDAL